MNRRPEWAWDAYAKWHKAKCDHAKPETCGFEMATWFQRNDGWARTSQYGATVTFYEDGRIEQ